MFAIFKIFKLKVIKHVKLFSSVDTLEKQGLIFEMVWKTPCTNQGFSCSDETPLLNASWGRKSSLGLCFQITVHH